MKNQGSKTNDNKKKDEELTPKQRDQNDLVNYLIKNPETVVTISSGNSIANKFKIGEGCVWIAVVDFIGDADVTFEFQKKSSNAIEKLEAKFRFGQGGIKHTILKLEDVENPSRWKKFSVVSYNTREDFMERRPATVLSKISKTLPKAPTVKFQPFNDQKKRGRDEDDDVEDDDGDEEDDEEMDEDEDEEEEPKPSKNKKNRIEDDDQEEDDQDSILELWNTLKEEKNYEIFKSQFMDQRDFLACKLTAAKDPTIIEEAKRMAKETWTNELRKQLKGETERAFTLTRQKIANSSSLLWETAKKNYEAQHLTAAKKDEIERALKAEIRAEEKGKLKFDILRTEGAKLRAAAKLEVEKDMYDEIEEEEGEEIKARIRKVLESREIVAHLGAKDNKSLTLQEKADVGAALDGLISDVINEAMNTDKKNGKH